MKHSGQDRQSQQAATQLGALNQASAAAAQAAQSQLGNQSAAHPVVPPAPAVPTGAIVLTKPRIKLVEYVHLEFAPYNGMTKDIRPERAYILNGAIVIEEYGLILPLAGSHVRTR